MSKNFSNFASKTLFQQKLNMQTLLLTISFIYGACIGSFLNVVILRLPEGKRLNGRSHCPGCGHNLAWWELLPLLSFLALKGKCSSCGKKISSQYFIIELLTAALFMLSLMYLRPASPAIYILLLKYWLSISVLIVVFLVDFRHYLILDGVIFPGMVGAAVLNLVLDIVLRVPFLSVHSNFFGGIVGALAASSPFFLLWYFSRGRFMGFGDVKLALLLGLILGYPQVLVCLFLAVILGGAVSVVLLLATNKTLKSQIPFGTFLSLAAIFCLFYGGSLLHWYLAILGF